MDQPTKITSISYIAELIYKYRKAAIVPDKLICGITYEICTNRFPEFIKHKKINGLPIDTLEGFDNAFPDIKSCTRELKINECEIFLENLIDYYIPTTSYDELNELNTMSEIYTFLLEKSNIEKDENEDEEEKEDDRKSDDDSSSDHSDYEPDDSKRMLPKFEITESQSSYLTKNLFLEPDSIRRQSVASKLSLFSTFNNAYNMGSMSDTDMNNFETMCYYYALGYAVLHPDTMEIVLKKTTTSFLEPVKMPSFIIKDQLISKPFGKLLWKFISLIYTIKLNNQQDRRAYIYYLIIFLMKKLELGDMGTFNGKDLIIKFRGPIKKRINHLSYFTVITKYFDADVFNDGVRIAHNRLIQMFAGILLKMTSTIIKWREDHILLIDCYKITPIDNHSSPTYGFMSETGAILLLAMLCEFD